MKNQNNVLQKVGVLGISLMWLAPKLLMVWSLKWKRL